jgi:hypothetical protein
MTRCGVVPEAHVVRFNHWKWPCVLTYERLLARTDASVRIVVAL